MIHPENDLGQFVAVFIPLEDGSSVHDVRYLTPYGNEIVAEPASEKCAMEMALALEHVRRAYLDCGSDVAISLLSDKLFHALSI